MKFWIGIAATVFLASGSANAQSPSRPAWAFIPVEDLTPPSWDKAKIKSLTGAARTFSETEIHDFFDTADWYPGRHAPMPEIVAKGRRPDVRACTYCHGAMGEGQSENAVLAGLNADYLVRQVKAFQSGERPLIPAGMSFALKATDEEIRAAAAYFSSLPRPSRFRVVETDEVPKSIVKFPHLPVTDERGGTERLGQRIVELPQDQGRATDRDPSVGMIAYVPKGSLPKGKALASGNGALPCAACHGEGLKGMGEFPALAGASPLYVARQLFNFRAGVRHGGAADIMKPIAEKLTDNDIVNLSAYFADLK